MQSISLCFIDFENVPSKRYSSYSLLNSIPAQQQLDVLIKIECHVWQNLPPAPCGNGIDLYRDIKRLQVLVREGLNIPILKPSFRQNWQSRVSQKKIEAAGD